MVNMVQIWQLPDESLNAILEESPEPYSEGSTETINSCPPFPPGFVGELFMVSHDSVAVDGKNSVQCYEREARNTDRQRRHNEEAANAAQATGGGLPPLARNLQHEFLKVDNQQVEQTPSANLAVATNELGRLPQTLEVVKIQALLKAAQVQVSDIQNPAPFLTASARSRHPRGSRQDGGSHYHSSELCCNQREGQLVQRGSRGNIAVNLGSQVPRDRYGRPVRPNNRDANQEVNQPLHDDPHDRINANLDARDPIENSRTQRHQAELQCRQEYDNNHGAPAGILALPAIEHAGPRPFTARPRAVQWPASFKIFGVDPYDGKANPEQWLQLYEIAIRATGGSSDVMANYLPVMLAQSANN
ncbi:uncharacterized protein [Miscanthus floridulus]|uniref:uncharacterized protein n=1 Tax=Miscanthus floridulus TaxID=154761 RepID=UPI00345742BC